MGQERQPSFLVPLHAFLETKEASASHTIQLQQVSDGSQELANELKLNPLGDLVERRHMNEERMSVQQVAKVKRVEAAKGLAENLGKGESMY